MALADSLIQFSGVIGSLPVWATAIIIVWTIVWKGLALWKSARLNSPIWFVILLVINTFGLIEILYLFVFSEMKFNHLRSKRSAKRKR